MKVKESCQHFWLIGSAHGETSEGFCKFCHEKRLFLNSVDLGRNLIPRASWGRGRTERKPHKVGS
mgnify:CR=1 FL=1